MLRIYGTINSRTARTLWMVEELGVPYELVEVDYVAKQTRTPAFLAINPNGHVPVIDDDGFTLHESMAINHYLIRKHADSPIAPRGLEEEARCLSWSFWVVTEVEASALTVLMHGAILPVARRDPQKLARATGALRPPLGVVEQALATGPCLLGERFTIADLNVAAVLEWTLAVPALPAEFPLAHAWLKRCLDRPACRRIKAMRKAAAADRLPASPATP